MPRVEIFPQTAIVYPNDRVRFTTRATPPPGLWVGFINAQVNSDFSLESTSGSTLLGLSGHQLISGIGEATITISNNSRPTGSGFVWLQALNSTGSTMLYRVEINATTIKFYSDVPTLLDTYTYSIQSGDTVTLELAGVTFRAYVNGVLRNTFTSGLSINYPFGYSVYISDTVAASPKKIAAPDIQGDWQLVAYADWTTPSHGSLSAATGISVEYFNGTIPGVYELKATLAGAAPQVASATILIPALTITGSNAITLQPGEKVRFKTNYDAAQTRLVSWSVVSGGGSFSNDEFTAPTAPGTTVVRASYGNQRADITITIPAIVTPTQTAATPGEQITFTTNMTGTTNWTADYGTPTSGSGSSFVWTAPNVAGPTVKIKADNGTFSKTIEIPVLLAFPYTDPALPLSWDRRKTVLVSRAEDRTRAARVKDKGALAFESFELSYKNRTTTELQTVHDFWDDHYPGKRFIFEDRLRDVRKVVYFDSDIRQEGNARCGIDYSFRVVEG